MNFLLFKLFFFLLLLFLSAFFSGAEAAIFHLPIITIDKLVRRYKRLRILKRRELLLGTILFGNTLVNVSASIIAGQIVLKLFHNTYIGVLTGGMTYIILVCCEITPKLYSLRNSEYIAIKATPILNFLRYLLSPIIVPLEAVISLVAPRQTTGFTKDEVLTFIKSEEKLSEGAKKIIFNLMEFKKVTAKDLMTPLSKLECLDSQKKLTPELITSLSHSKVPVYENVPSNLTGILYTKDLLKTTNYNIKEQSISNIMRIPIFIEASVKATEIFTKFRRRHTHIAIVIDKSISKSTTSQNKPNAIGIITLEDILKNIIKK